ncbi:MAG: hypothetical protein ACYC8W_03795 [Candidatus Tyrphobacter sp.]
MLLIQRHRTLLVSQLRAIMARAMPSKPKPLEPLIPLDEFGKLVAKIAHVPKDKIEATGAAKPPRKKPKAHPKRRARKKTKS